VPLRILWWGADAGKSTLAGSILFLTGNVDKRIIEKFEREAKERGRDSW
jgi:peptide chain release factor subunit 3